MLHHDLADDTDEEVIRLPSMRLQVGALEVGESFPRVQRFNYDVLTRHDLRAAISSLRNAMLSALTRAKEDTGNEYTIEQGEMFTRSKDLLLLVVITRTK